jgi:hypothetical protein
MVAIVITYRLEVVTARFEDCAADVPEYVEDGFEDGAVLVKVVFVSLIATLSSHI